MAALAFAGCKQESPAAPEPGGDRTLEKLKAEVDRANRGAAVGHAPNAVVDPNAHLAGLAVDDARPRVLELPERNETGWVGPLAVKLEQVTAMHSVRAGRVQLTTEDVFVEVKVVTQNTGKTATDVDFNLAQIVDAGGHTYGLARDAQRAAGTRELQRSYGPDERQEISLYFEVSASIIGHGMRLLLPAGVCTGAESDLELPID
ncbi:MAG: hypothetical protein IRZ16_22265 [Myxococcaceae bacterium]|nr:hypothetical protein [Myxococcaceae bacterium]